ncbi:MAG TPA: hypothetical protein VFL55_03570 [Acetobacteraceae bacterium]|nr:hypothetical protein [Acetobacteraceae bacterium]
MSTRGAWWAAAALVSVSLLAPLLIVDVPPVLDYPNHLARFVLLASGDADPILAPMFEPHWTIIPNLAADLVAPEMLHLMPVHIAGRVLLGSILLLNLAGVVALHRVLFRRRSYWPLASALVAYNAGFLLGFLNWEIGCGLAMLAAAGWLRWREPRPAATIAGASVTTVALFFCHLVAPLFFLVLIGSAEVQAAWRDQRWLHRGMALLPAIVPPLVLAWLAPLRDAPAQTHWMTPQEKLLQLVSPFINYLLPLDVGSAVLVASGVAIAIVLGWVAVSRRMVPAIALLAALYIVLPFDLKSASFLDTRIALMLGFLLFAATEPTRLPAWTRRVAAVALITLFAIRMAVLAEAWAKQRHDLAELRSVIANVPPGASVYMTNVPPEEAPTYWASGPHSRILSNGLRAEYHLPALLVIEQHAFWPLLFANPAQQPIRLRPTYARLAREAHDIPPHAALVADPGAGSADLRQFDYALMLEAGADRNLAGFVPRCLTLMSRTNFAALFRVRRDAASC